MFHVTGQQVSCDSSSKQPRSRARSRMVRPLRRDRVDGYPTHKPSFYVGKTTIAVVVATATWTSHAAAAAAASSARDASLFVGPVTLPGAPGTRMSRGSEKSVFSSAIGMQRSRWCDRSTGGARRTRAWVPGLAASSDDDDDNGGKRSSSGGDDDDNENVDWGKIKPEPGQEPDWDKILPKGREAPEMPPAPPGLSKLDPRERLTAYAGMLDWEPMDLDEEEEKEKTYEDLNQEMGDEWLANKLQSALRKSQNRNVQSNVNKAYINEWLDEEKQKLDETAEDLKEAYRKDAERIKKKMMEEFDKEARVMDIKVANIIARGKSNFTQFTGPLTDQTAFPASVAAEFAYLAEDEAAFYEELGVAPPSSEGSPDTVTLEERNQMEAEMRTLSPADVIKQASAQAAAAAKKN
ncbi:unnamed protein product, partial [Ectocarpus sp. 12 AP-2014]